MKEELSIDIIGLAGACSYALDCIEAELVNIKNKHGKRVAYISICMAEYWKIYSSIVSIIFFNESADSLSFNASSPLKLIGISDSIPSAPTIAGILNDTPSISYTP